MWKPGGGGGLVIGVFGGSAGMGGREGVCGGG